MLLTSELAAFIEQWLRDNRVLSLNATVRSDCLAACMKKCRGQENPEWLRKFIEDCWHRLLMAGKLAE